jgi:hypothetical protein
MSTEEDLHMPAEITVASNVKQAVPFLNVTDIEAPFASMLTVWGVW